MGKLNLDKLEAKGFKVTTVKDFLGLTPEDEVVIELRLALSDAVKKRRQAAKLTQQDLAKRLGSSQSRVAKIEAGDSSVGFDLLIKSLVATGLDTQGLGKILVEYKS